MFLFWQSGPYRSRTCLKNFALPESPSEDYLLSPAYDLINTAIHVNDSDFALNEGLFADDYKSAVFKKTNHAGLKDFLELSRRLDIKEH